MDVLETLLQGLPLWMQALVVILVMIVGAAIGVKIPKRGSARKNTAQKRTTAKSTLTGSTREPRATPPQRSNSNDDELSPGQFGPDATTDLPASALASLKLSYAPSVDGTPDPGEVVWTWVPFEENDGRGKDRPVLIVGRIDSTSVAGCYLSTKEHRGFVYVGPGDWDLKGRPSYLNPERVLRITDGGMRREGAIVDRAQFEAVAKKLVAYYNR